MMQNGSLLKELEKKNIHVFPKLILNIIKNVDLDLGING